jgi:hypothetical protein
VCRQKSLGRNFIESKNKNFEIQHRNSSLDIIHSIFIVVYKKVTKKVTKFVQKSCKKVSKKFQKSCKKVTKIVRKILNV